MNKGLSLLQLYPVRKDTIQPRKVALMGELAVPTGQATRDTLRHKKKRKYHIECI